jgi:hypothetical protein
MAQQTLTIFLLLAKPQECRLRVITVCFCALAPRWHSMMLHAAGAWADGRCVNVAGNIFLSNNPSHPDFQDPLLNNKYFYDARANGGWSLQNWRGSHRWSNSGDINGQTLCITKTSPFALNRANVPQDAYTYSSVWGSNDEQRSSHSTGTIDSRQGWSAKSNDGGQWIQMNLGSAKWVDGIVTQGRANGFGQYVTRYAVLTSEDGYSFSSRGVFPGNIDQGQGLQYTVFKPVRAQYVRVVPVAWNNHITMRVDVLLGDGDSLRHAVKQSVQVKGTATGLFARWYRMKLQKLPSVDVFESARPVRLSTVPNLNFKSTDGPFANSGLKTDYVARFEGYGPACFSHTASQALLSGSSTSPIQAGGPLNSKATTAQDCSLTMSRRVTQSAVVINAVLTHALLRLSTTTAFMAWSGDQAAKCYTTAST